MSKCIQCSRENINSSGLCHLCFLDLTGPKKTLKERILKKYDEKFSGCFTGLNASEGHVSNVLDSSFHMLEIRNFLSQSLGEIREETITECVNTVMSKRSCRSHEPENCHVCLGRDEAIKSLNKLRK